MGGLRWLAGGRALALFAGCSSSVQEQARSEAAFQAGQRHAFMEFGARQNAVSVQGPVIHPVLPWSEEMTLGQAMMAAGWRHPTDWQAVIIWRASDSLGMTALQAIAAAGFTLEPGDLVEIIP